MKAQEYFLQNKSNNEITEALKDFVINEMFWNQEPPDFKRRKFFPTKKDIRNFNARVRDLCRFSDEELEGIRKVIEQCQAKDTTGNISFQVEEKALNEDKAAPADSTDDEGVEPDPLEVVVTAKKKKKKDERKVHSFVFCHQSSKQQRLLKRYCNVAYLVEIETLSLPKRILTYKMYALVVQTNVDFQSVGTIIVSKQRRDALVEALTLFREWNPNWKPKYLLVDFSEAIFESTIRVFPEVNFFINPSSCEAKWSEFIDTPSNGVKEYRDVLLSFLKNMQYSLTEDSLACGGVAREKRCMAEGG